MHRRLRSARHRVTFPGHFSDTDLDLPRYASNRTPPCRAFSILAEMTSTEPRLQAALVAALTQIGATVNLVAVRTADHFGALAQSSGRIAQRDLCEALQADMRRNLVKFQRVFDNELRAKVALDLAPRLGARRQFEAQDWETMTLVDDREIDGRLHSDRIGQQITHACEGELRDLAAHMGALNSASRDLDRNPLRAEVLGAALYRAIEAISDQPEARKLLVQDLGVSVARAMPECYAAILRDLQARGVQPVPLTVRAVEGPGFQLPGLHSGYATLDALHSRLGGLDAPAPLRAPSAGVTGRDCAATHSGHGPRTQADAGADSRLSSNVLEVHRRTDDRADVDLMELLRRLTVLEGQPGEPGSIDLGGSATCGLKLSRQTADGATEQRILVSGPDHSNLMAVNLIQAHRGELVQASAGKLDSMVIDVVGSWFEQILSDPRVPPQMARQIARLQLPVLRMALHDASFFTSRHHPVRRFVDRVASLGCAFDDFDAGPGKQFLDRVRDLVQEIAEGNFDQLALYTAKLAALESFIGDPSRGDAAQQDAVSALNHKESELRLQQRCMVQLRAALSPLPLPLYLRDFLAKVWSQALVLAATRYGAESDRPQRYRRVGRDLVMSVQPKGLPSLRKKFLMTLPTLMKDLHEGLQMIGWPAAEQRDFFSKLLPAHAESLNAAPTSELDRNMLGRQLDAVFKLAVPDLESLAPADPVPALDGAVIARHFTADEALRIGLVDETAVDWMATVEAQIDFEINRQAEALPLAATDLNMAPDAPPARPAPPRIGAEPAPDPSHPDGSDAPGPSRDAVLIDQIELGLAYQLHLKDEWLKVRLTHVSAARSFFVFTTGRKHQETISMTAHMVARMCATGRMRGLESAGLMERATQRARDQLAAMRAPGRP